MTPVGTGQTPLPSTQNVKTQAGPVTTQSAPAPLKVEQNKVTLSEEGKALLAALQEIDKESQANMDGKKSVGEKVESFAHGALGMDHPEEIEQKEDGSYSAGQYLSAAATVGGILLAIL